MITLVRVALDSLRLPCLKGQGDTCPECVCKPSHAVHCSLSAYASGLSRQVILHDRLGHSHRLAEMQACKP